MIPQIWTIGHSTRKIDIFISLLEENGIRLLADVRQFPGSKRYPQFNKDALADSLGKAEIRYQHFPELGGRRKPRPDSRNIAWRNASFRGYADYMETEEFRKAIARLVDLATGRVRPIRQGTDSSDRRTGGLANEVGPTAIMCAEALWWRCHRALISDFLKARGLEVIHIVDHSKTELHPFTSAARVVNGELSYRADELL
jgi:uncharacterized protein (DUF488 family)